ncbi:MAG: AAA-like domain-containing protein, partial [Chloroflexota bacterium]
KLGSTTTIRGARQTGKTSLLARGIHHARNAGGKTIWIDFQEFDGMRLDTISVFLHTLAINVCRELRMDNSSVHQYRQDNTITPQSFTAFLEDRILCHSDSPVIFAMDEADSILRTSFYQDFFGLVRSWHNRRAVRPEPWQKLNIVLIISTEPYLLIDDINQSPFNVGARIELSDFTENLVHDLNQRHGYPLTVEQVQSLMHLVNGQPYLIRKALYELAKDRITWDQLMKSATAEQGPFSDHLRHLYSIIVEQPALSRALQSVIHTQRSSHSGMSNSFWGMIRKSFKPERQSVSTDLMRLERAGIIKKVDAQYVCRCELYQRYFQEKFA